MLDVAGMVELRGKIEGFLKELKSMEQPPYAFMSLLLCFATHIDFLERTAGDFEKLGAGTVALDATAIPTALVKFLEGTRKHSKGMPEVLFAMILAQVADVVDVKVSVALAKNIKDTAGRLLKEFPYPFSADMSEVRKVMDECFSEDAVTRWLRATQKKREGCDGS